MNQFFAPAKRRKTGTSFVACPVCNKQVPASLINIHLDTSCCNQQPIARGAQKAAAAVQQEQPPQTSYPLGQTHITQVTSAAVPAHLTASYQNPSAQHEALPAETSSHEIIFASPTYDRSEQEQQQCVTTAPKMVSSTGAAATTTTQPGVSSAATFPTHPHTAGNNMNPSTLGHTHHSTSSAAVGEQPPRTSTVQSDVSLAAILETHVSNTPPNAPLNTQATNAFSLLMKQGPEQDRSRPGVSSVTPAKEKTIQVPNFSEEELAHAGGVAHPFLHGQYLFEDFLSESEQALLLEVVDKTLPAWTDQSFNGRYRGKAWGVRADLRARQILPASVPLPSLLLQLVERIQTLPPTCHFTPNECNAITYIKGRHHLEAHFDDRYLSADIIVNLSLCGACVMTFTRPASSGVTKQQSLSVRVPLPARTLQVLTKDARFNFTHAIHADDFVDEKRVSLTFRFSPLT